MRSFTYSSLTSIDLSLPYLHQFQHRLHKKNISVMSSYSFLKRTLAGASVSSFLLLRSFERFKKKKQHKEEMIRFECRFFVLIGIFIVIFGGSLVVFVEAFGKKIQHDG